MAGTFTFPGIYCCIGHEIQNTLSPVWGLYIFIQFQGASPPPLYPGGLSGLTLNFLYIAFLMPAELLQNI